MAVTPEGVEYIRGRLASGATKDQISAELLSGGWKIADIDEAFSIAVPAPHVPLAPIQEEAADTQPQAGIALQKTFAQPEIELPNMTVAPSLSNMPMRRRSHTLRNVIVSLIVFIGILLCGAAAYAYTTGKLALIEQYAEKLMPFLAHSNAPYDKETVIGGVISELSQIQTSAWDVHVHAFTEPREQGATPLPLSKDSALVSPLQFLQSNFSADSDGTADMSGATQKTASGVDGRAAITFDIKSSSHTTSLAAEVRIIGDTYYGIISTIPDAYALVSPVKNQWISITPQDVASFGLMQLIASSTSIGADSSQEQGVKDLQTLFSFVEKDNILVSQDPKPVSVGGKSEYEYDLALNPSQVPTFYADAMQAFSSDASSTIQLSGDTLAYLKSADGAQLAQYLASNLSITIWTDTAGMPQKFELSLRVVPTSDMTALASKQIRVIGDLTLSDINAPLTIDAPTSTISFDDAFRMINGKSMQQFKQEANDSVRFEYLAIIRTALDKYKADKKAYPSSLTILVPNYLHAILTDPLDSAPFLYSSNGSSFTVGADLEATSSQSASNLGGVLLAASCSGKSDGRYCYEVKSVPAAKPSTTIIAPASSAGALKK